MIPKFIHHIWIGDKPFPSDYINFLKKWKILYPDYNFIFWDNQLVESTDILSSSSVAGCTAFCTAATLI